VTEGRLEGCMSNVQQAIEGKFRTIQENVRALQTRDNKMQNDIDQTKQGTNAFAQQVEILKTE
jgi:hypothetical protein